MGKNKIIKNDLIHEVIKPKLDSTTNSELRVVEPTQDDFIAAVNTSSTS